MSIQLGRDGAQEQVSHADAVSELKQLRSQHSGLLKERDRAVKRAEEFELEVIRERNAQRHALGIRCESPQCPERLMLLSSAPPESGKHAHALFTAAIMMGWDLGATTTGALFAMIGQPTPAAAHDGDLCPSHRAEKI